MQGLEQNLEDQLEIEYSPTYWLHNNTIVPTTTQRTTVSTSTQGGKSSLFSSSKSSNDIERITKSTLGDLKHRLDHGDDDDDVDDEDDDKKSGARALGQLSIGFLVTLSLLKAFLF
jgi:hypothetical protein